MKRRELLKVAGGAAAVALRRGLLDPSIYASETLAARLARDPRRPQFHLLPAANWMNDPNGPIFWNGRYHMFFQYNPDGAYWGDMHWAHAISADMVHWKHAPIALEPTPGGPDAAGCFSGTAVVDNGMVSILYTGVVNATTAHATLRDGVHSFRETQCLATSTDPELNVWSKLPRPVIAVPPSGLTVTGFRDPSAWRSGDWWYLTVGSGTPHKGGNVLLYRSKDLRHWEYMHVLTSGPGSSRQTVNPVASGDMWECAELFPVGGKHVLIYSSVGAVHWQSGHLDEQEMKFHPDRSGIVDNGTYYAAKTQLDAQGRRILWGWIGEARAVAEYKAAGWAGMMSLPREVGVGDNGQLMMEVSREVEALRRQERKLLPGNNVASQLEHFIIAKATGEMLAKLERGREPFTIDLVGALPGGPMSIPLVTLEYSPNAPEQITMDGKQISIQGSKEEQLELHAYFDGSVAEVFLQRSVAYTKRFYYRGSVAPDIRLVLKGRSKALESLSMWQLEPVSPDRLTS